MQKRLDKERQKKKGRLKKEMQAEKQEETALIAQRKAEQLQRWVKNVGPSVFGLSVMVMRGHMYG